MPITINGNGTITGISSGGLPAGTVTSATLASGAITASAMPAGSVVQTLQVIKTDTMQTSSSGWNDISGLNCNITMTKATNKVLVLVNLTICNNSTTGSISAVQRTTSGTGTFVGIATSGYGNRQNGGGHELYESRQDSTKSDSYTVLDTPGAGTHNYAVMVQPKGQALYVNRSANDSNSSDFSRGTSSIIVMEIAQ